MSMAQIVEVHGSGGNLASLPLRALARGLSAKGYAALSINTRQHDEHVNTDNFFDVDRDIEAAGATVRAAWLPVHCAYRPQPRDRTGSILRRH